MKLRARHIEYLWDAINGLLLAVALTLLLSSVANARTVLVEVADGVKIGVEVTEECFGSYQGERANRLTYKLYLCGDDEEEGHGLAHFAGMNHGPWKQNALENLCATVYEAGYKTGYEVGNVICRAPGGRGEFVDKN